MKRPILIAVVGYIIGIIIGLYFKISIALFYGMLFIIYFTIKIIYIKIKKHKFSLYSISRYLRYLKLFINKKVIFLFIVFSCISNIIIINKNKYYNQIYKISKDVEIEAKIEGLIEEKEYQNKYKIKVTKLNGKEEGINLYLITKDKVNYQYGDIVNVKGEYIAPSIQRNFGGFNYSNYLKTLNVYGTVKASNIEIKKKLDAFDFNKMIFDLQESIKNKAKQYLYDDSYSIYLGLILGDTSNIDNETMENFRNSNMAHILAVSGMHVSYIVIGISIILNKVFGKRKSKIICIFILIFYCFITGFSPSIIRASIMAILVLLSGLFHRKDDIWNSLAISLFIILIYNPFLITSISLQYSYIGVIGILIFYKSILQFFKRKSDKFSKLKQIVAISLSSQIFIIPLTIYHFNTLGIYYILTNLILSIIIGPLIICGFIFLILILIKFPLLNIIAFPLQIGIKIILNLSNISKLPFSKIYVKTPQIYEIIIFYIIVIFINIIYKSQSKKKLTNSGLRLKLTYQLIKYKFKSKFKNKKRKLLIICTIIVFTICSLIIIRPKKLRIHFVDVGQGDCCFIETPGNKTILIDGGGTEFGDFDVGKNTLLPYILDRGYTSLDYVIISHFDTDHIGGVLTVLQELQVGQVIISKQAEISENYRHFKEIVNKKNIQVLIVGANYSKNEIESSNNNANSKKYENKKIIYSSKEQIEKDLYFDFLWPNNDFLLTENALNNNSLVCKLHYMDFSMLFTGDIEDVAEKHILHTYSKKTGNQNSNINVNYNYSYSENSCFDSFLNSTVLKVGHHGSKISTTQEFLEAVNPQIALIGVGENNKFGHPNDIVIKRLEDNGAKIYRTDKNGEISIIVNNQGKVTIKKLINTN